MPIVSTHQIHSMSFIKLAPMRMSDLKITPDATTKNPVSSRYTPPSKRAATLPPIVTSLDFAGGDFPSLDSSPRMVKSPSVGGFKQKILDLIAKDELDEAERNGVSEIDPKKMTQQQRLESGWAILPVGNIKESGLRFNEKLYQSMSLNS